MIHSILNELTQCSECHKFHDSACFMSEYTGKRCKTCDICRKRQRLRSENNKCIHRRRKNRCKDCGGDYFCIHNRIKHNCKECKGSGICIHNRLKYNCKDCGGPNICIHNHIKYSCKKCWDAGISKHSRYAIKHKKRNGSICIHNKVWTKCKLCKRNNYGEQLNHDNI